MSVPDLRKVSATPSAPGLALLVVDDVCLFREGLAAILVRQPGVGRVSTAAGLPAAVAALRDDPPDLVLINLGTPGSRDVLRAVGTAPDAPQMIVVGVTEAEEQVVACAEAGVHGYLLRSEPLEHLLHLMRSVAAGETLCTPRVTAVLLRRVATLAAEVRPPGRVPVLTDREDQVLALLDEGLSNQEIAGRLGIEVRTVKNHVHHILEKVGARRRGEAVAAFRRLGLVPGGST